MAKIPAHMVPVGADCPHRKSGACPKCYLRTYMAELYLKKVLARLEGLRNDDCEEAVSHDGQPCGQCQACVISDLLKAKS